MNPWRWQWEEFEYGLETEGLFLDWIHPNKLQDFEGKTVLDAGCGSGYHLRLIAGRVHSGLGVDLNTGAVARKRLRKYPHMRVESHDIAEMFLSERFDIVYSLGVLHHTDDPSRSFRNIAQHCRPGGRVIIWVYSHEGNFLNRMLLEPMKKVFFSRLPRFWLEMLAEYITALMYAPIYTVYLLPLRFLPFYEYFENWRKLSYRRNTLNVFDKLNAPVTHFIPRETVEQWFYGWENVHISPYCGVSWRASGTKPKDWHGLEKEASS